LDAVILSHAHIDHCGNLPNLVKQGYRGPIYATAATVELADVMMRDSGRIQEADAGYVSKRRRRRGEAGVEPLYTEEDAAAAAELLRPVGYGERFAAAEGVEARLVEAGHILGSAAVSLEIEERGRKVRVWFSGDIGRRKLPLLRDPVLPEGAEVMIMECTYGDKPHRDPDAAFEEFRDVVERTVKRGGKVIIPAFAVGRTQELVFGLNRMMESGDVPRVPVYVDSPLAVDVSDIFRRHPECFDEETRAFVASERGRQALGFDMLRYVRSVEESKALNERREPMVVISASGMAETGRILHHLRNNVENPRNTVVIVSWQAPNTLGRRLADREERVKIFGEVYERRAEVATIGGLSAHAGQDLLVEYAQAVREAARQVFLVHGEAGPAGALMERLRGRGVGQVLYPGLHTAVEI
jgi:metallo-beta-lactamase family protein